MPIWQFDLAFIPSQQELPTRSASTFDIAPLPAPAMARIRSLLHSRCGRPSAVGPGISSYGSLEGNRIDVIEFGSGVRELWACIDARAEADDFCSLVCSIAALADCELFSPEMEAVISPDRQALISALMNSSAWGFALDPALFTRRAHRWERAR